jgi:hypothetical protein
MVGRVRASDLVISTFKFFVTDQVQNGSIRITLILSYYKFHPHLTNTRLLLYTLGRIYWLHHDEFGREGRARKQPQNGRLISLALFLSLHETQH